MRPTDRPILELCVDGPEALSVAQDFADRIELCSGLEIGGLTATPGLIAMARQSIVPCHVLIRPRSGDFEYSRTELDACCLDVVAVREAGLAGVVVGAANKDKLDENALLEMKAAAGPIDVSLHRVIDVLPDKVSALDAAVSMGFQRVLTSGGYESALGGRQVLAELVTAAKRKIDVVAGARIDAAAVEPLWSAGIRQFHASCTSRQKQANPDGFGFSGHERRVIDRAKVEGLRCAIDRMMCSGRVSTSPS